MPYQVNIIRLYLWHCFLVIVLLYFLIKNRTILKKNSVVCDEREFDA